MTVQHYEVQQANRNGVFSIKHPNLMGMSTFLIMRVYLLPRYKMPDQNHMKYKEKNNVRS